MKLFVGYVSGDAYWSSDVIPEVTGNANNNLAYSPDFTALAGTQAATLNVVLGTRQAEAAAVAMSIFPNPALGEATVAYRVLDHRQPVAVAVLDLLGRPVQTLLNEAQDAGIHELHVVAGTPGGGQLPGEGAGGRQSGHPPTGRHPIISRPRAPNRWFGG